MSQIKTLVLMQLRDKMDTSWIKSVKEAIHVIGLNLLKFLVLTGVYTAILYGLVFLGVFYYYDLPSVMTFIVSLVLIMLIVSDTIGLTESLYFSEDNKVLITLPTSNNKIFISKLLVFFTYEIKRSFSFTIPIILGCMINIALNGSLSGWSFVWMIVPMIFIIALPVLISALLSIPTLYIYRFVKRFVVAKFVLIGIGLTLYVLLILSITRFIPEEINLINDWKSIREAIVHFLTIFESYNLPIKYMVRMLIGEPDSANNYVITGWIFLYTGVLIASCGVLYLLCYFISRPIFFNMMSKNFEFNKDSQRLRKNHTHNKFMTFNIKEAKVSFRSAEIAFNYLMTYTTVPIMLYLIDLLFMAMDKSAFGTYMSYSFNVLLITFPLLLSNSLVATLYSKEGRAGYIKKTKPVNPILPLTAKLSFNIILVIPSVIGCAIVFSNYVEACALAKPGLYQTMNAGDIILFILAILLLYYAHLFYSAKMDITNPQNEQYATSGNSFINPNEVRSGTFAVILSIIYSLFVLIFFNELIATISGSITKILAKLLVASLLLAIYFIGSYVLSIKALYAPNRE